MSPRLTDCGRGSSRHRTSCVRPVRQAAVVVLVDDESSNVVSVSVQVGPMHVGINLRPNGAELVSSVAVRTDSAAQSLARADIGAPEYTAARAVPIVV